MNAKPGLSTPPSEPAPLAIKIFGVGDAGLSLLEALRDPEFTGAGLIAVNSDPASLASSSAGLKIHLETRLLRGLGTGGDPERGRALAEEQFATLKSACAEASVVFILAGLGGGAGSGISPVLARAAKEAGAMTLAFVTLPFPCEGNRRQQQAQLGLDALKTMADGVVCLPGDRWFKLMDESTGVLDTFRITDALLLEGVRGVWRLLTRRGLIQIHFNDLRALLHDRHTQSVFASLEAAGPGRSREIVDKLSAHPLLDEGRALAEADAVLISLIGGRDLTMAEVNRVMEQISRQCERAQIIMGAAVDDSFKGRLSVTVIAARQNNIVSLSANQGQEGHVAGLPAAATGATDEGESAVPYGTAAQTPPDYGAPTPHAMGLGRSMSKPHAAGRGRKTLQKMRQAQLPLAIISKGRFDKSEPTVHKGEDLDLPTYIRRGVPLN
ncbi:MAG: cell division protein FtsZ [Verrucomicrobiota bacterium]|jgi:cell division protein FtsZ